jgi:Mg2+-importing ATPase
MSLTVCSLTGESEPQRKTAAFQSQKTDSVIFELENILFRGTSVISGSGVALVLRTGDGEDLAFGWVTEAS